MDESIVNQTQAWIIALLLFIIMLISTFVGKLIGNYVRNKNKNKEKSIETSPLTALLFFLTGIYIWHEWSSVRFTQENCYRRGK